VDTLSFRAFVLLTAAIAGTTLFSLVSHNSWAAGILIWFVVHSVAYWGMHRLKVQPRARTRIKQIWFAVSMIVAAIFVSQFRPPLTSMMVTVKDAPAASQLQLASVRGTRGTSKATFFLIRGIKEDIQRLELRFGDHPYDWTLVSIEVGSDFARIPIPVASWTGAEIIESRYMKPLMTRMTQNSGNGNATLKVDANELRRAKRPAIRLNLSRAIVVKQSVGARYELLRAGWLVIALLTLIMAILLPKFIRLVKHLAARTPTTAVLGYLNSSSGKPRT